MTTDHDLRRRFKDLGQADEREAPSFGPVWARALARVESHGRRARWRVGLAYAGGIAATILALVVLHGWPRVQPTDLAHWRSPTAFLLQSPAPANEILRSLPRFGSGFNP